MSNEHKGCGGNGILQTVDVKCNGQYVYRFVCDKCGARYSIDGLTPEEQLRRIRENEV